MQAIDFLTYIGSAETILNKLKLEEEDAAAMLSWCEKRWPNSKSKPMFISELAGIHKQQHKIKSERDQRIKFLYNVPDLPDILRRVLIMRHIDGLTFETIADRLYYSPSYVSKELHNKALAAFDESLKQHRQYS